MFFGKKRESGKACENCNSKNAKGSNFCSNCGYSLLSPEEEMKQFGFLGRNDSLGLGAMPANLGALDKVFSSIMQGLVKSMESQINNRSEMAHTEVKSYPNGIRIKMGPFPLNRQKEQEQKNSFKKVISTKQIEKMSSLPRVVAKSRVRRLGDKVVYELATPGVSSPEDVFVTRVESGYEVKAIGEKKIYVNSLPFNLPIKKVELAPDKLLVEFHPENRGGF